MKIAIILASYDSGNYHEGFGQGPDALIAGGLVEALTLNDHDVTVEDIGQVGEAQEREIATGFAVCKAVATKIRIARDDDRFPIVLCGNCLTAAGAIAGEIADSIIWFDQHGDINTPETSPFGFLDGMALATALGLCWRPMANAIPGFKPIDPAHCMLVGARDLDESEKELMETLPLIRATCAEAPDKVEMLKATGVKRTHLHLDLDVHNPDALQVNRYTTPGGPNPEQLREVVRNVSRAMPISGVTVSAYNPAFDPQADVPPVVGRLLADLLSVVDHP